MMLLLNYDIFYCFAGIVLSRSNVSTDDSTKASEALAVLVGLVASHCLRTIPERLFMHSYFDARDASKCKLPKCIAVVVVPPATKDEGNDIPPDLDLRDIALHADFDSGGGEWRLGEEPKSLSEDEPPPVYTVNFEVVPVGSETADPSVVWAHPKPLVTNMWGPLSTCYIMVGSVVGVGIAAFFAAAVHFIALVPHRSSMECAATMDPWTRIVLVHFLVDPILAESGRILLALLARYSKEDDNQVDFSASTGRRLRQLLATDGHPVWRARVRWPDEMFNLPDSV